MSRGRDKPQPGGPLTPEQVAKASHVYRIYVLYAVVMMWVIALLDALWLHESAVVLVGLAVLYSVTAPWILRYLKADLNRRVVRSQNHPDIGL